MTDEQTTPTDTQGKETNTPKENTDTPISEYDKALALVKRREEASKVELEILARKEKLATDALLAGTSGGKVEPTPPEKISDEEYADKLQRGEVDPLGEDGISID